MSSNKEAITLVVITFLLVVLIYSSVAKFNAFGQYGSYEHCTYTGQYPPVDDLSWSSTCCGYKNTDNSILGKATPPIMVCQICKGVGFQKQCFPPHQRVIATLRPAEPQQPPPPPKPPSAPLTALFNTSPGASQFNAPLPTGGNTSNQQQSPQQQLQGTQQQQEQQPTTTTCPDGSTPDANGNCPSSNTLQQIAPPSSEHHHKGSNNLLGGESTTTKKTNNNSSSVS
jgi:hypothetical protein